MRNVNIALLFLLLTGTAAADSSGHPLTLWLAEGAHNRIYLLGSVHLLRASDHPLPPAIDSAYADADALVMELDMDDIDPAAMQALVNELGVLKGDATLSDLMGDELYKQAQAAAARIDIPLELLAKSEPWLAAITIEQLALNRLGFNPLYGVEMHLSSKAMTDGKEIHGLETVDEQLNFLDGLSLDTQRDLLLQTLEENADSAKLMDSIISAWRHGDLEFLEDNMLDDMAKYPELLSALVVNRNRRWVDSIDDLLNDSIDYLIVVGTLHLVGADGVPELLAKRGVSIRQLHQPAP